MNESKVNEEVNRATEAFLQMQILHAQMTQPDLKELTYIKSRIDVENGGLYLLTLIHVDGPKIKLTSESNDQNKSN